MTDNGSSWPPDQHDPRLFQPPRPLQPPPPLHHDPRTGDPRSADPRRAADSPWRRTQRHAQPDPAGWPPAPPSPPAPQAPQGPPASYGASPSYDSGPGPDYGPGPGRDYGAANRGGDPDPYAQPGGDDYDNGRFVPGFGDYPDEDYQAEPPRRGRSARRSGRGRSAPPPGPPRRPRRRRFRWLAPLIAAAVFLIPAAIGGAYAFSFYMSKYHPADYSGAGTGRIVVQVPSGSSPTSLGPELVNLGVVASARAFVLAAEHSSNPNGLLPGFYGMKLHMRAAQAYALLLNPKNLVQVTITIPEGWRVSQIVAYLGAKSGIPAASYSKALANPGQLDLPSAAGGKPEGYLFPATYEVQPHETATGVLAGMVQRFDQEAAAVNLPAAAKQVHLTEAQVITMASLVEAEGGRTSDYPKIARVIYNRLAQGIPLQLDSTVLYGLNTYGIIASDSQLTSKSPYNTYKFKGLTPGPIDSPGDAAIKAVLHPATGNWIYFVTVNPKTGETLFTNSQSQFEQFRAELEHNLGQG
jgi:UPF0755 protein